MNIKRKVQEITGYVSIVIAVVIAISSIVIRFSFPSLKETELFLKAWWLFIPLIFCVIGFHWGFKDVKRNLF